jgi:hypothetical protein
MATDPTNKFKSFLNTTAALSEVDTADLLKDCKDCFTCREVEDGDNYSVGSTFFLRADETPRCGLEALAMQVFKAHTAAEAEGGRAFDPAKSGAEWWTQYIDHRDVCITTVYYYMTIVTLYPVPHNNDLTIIVLTVIMLHYPRTSASTGTATTASRKTRSDMCTPI